MVRKVKWSSLGLAALAVAFSATTALAQVNATVVMKSGERFSGHNISYRIDRREVSFMSNQAQRFGVDQVAYVDFGGNADSARVEGNQEAVVLRDGTVLRGQLIELNHGVAGDESSPYLVIFKTDGGEEKRLPPSQVARVYFSGGAASLGTSGTSRTAATGDGLVISAKQQWTPAGLVVRSGDRLSFSTSGEIQLSTDNNDIAGSAGAKSKRMAPNAPLPNAYAGALIAKVGENGRVFPIGDQASVTMPAAGQLFLGINDDDTNDNQGEFRVKITRSGRTR
jgi:hypothetical protein